MLIYGIVFGLVLLLFWISRKEKAGTDIKRGTRVWYRCASYLQKKLLVLRFFDKKTLSIGVVVITGGCVLGAVISFWEYTVSNTEIEVLDKAGYEEGAYQETLRVEEEGGGLHIIDVEIPNQIYTADQIKGLFKQALSEIEGYILAGNESPDYITEDMALITQIPGTPIIVSWTTDRAEILNYEGAIGSEIPEEGVTVNISAELSYHTHSEEYSRTVKVFPPVLSETEEKQQQILDEVADKNQNEEDKQFFLPDQVAGRKLTWFRIRESNGFIVFGTAVLAAVIFLMGRRKEQLQKKEDRKAQMMMDYPEILSKLILLLNAGLSMRKAFARIALDYKKQQAAFTGKKKIHYGYEEILVSFYEMERGVSEKEAYEHLGIRCELPVYRTFSVLLVQNLRKGSGELLEIMEREAAAAFEERKRRARIIGEQASTKLLLPMGLMLLIVFAVLLIPAFLSF